MLRQQLAYESKIMEEVLSWRNHLSGYRAARIKRSVKRMRDAASGSVLAARAELDESQINKAALAFGAPTNRSKNHND